mgnify:CR=1 FL=1|tara:strand:+ start:1958 stop:2197 length:240 start_codon:yes stop_codon:yes gene_type:complete
MKPIKSLKKEIKLFIVIILIFFIIFYSNLKPENKYYKKIIYYVMFLLFIFNLFLLKEFPGIVLLYSALFIFVWYEYNIV